MYMKKVFLFLLCLLLMFSFASCADESALEAGQQNVGENSETEPPKPVYDTTPVTIKMAGDILLHSPVTNGAKTGESAYDFNDTFSEIKKYLEGDLVVCNMEAPVDAFGGNQKIADYPLFNFPLEILDAVKNAGFNTLTSANNHAFDKGFEGLVNSRNNIINAGFGLIGTYENKEQHDEYYIKEYNGIKIGIIAYTDGDNGNWMSDEKREFVMKMFTSQTLEDVPRMIDDMNACRAAGADYIIMALHWGDEYNDQPDVGARKQREIAKALVEGGADIIMGNHAHCVQPIEKITYTTPGGKQKTGIVTYAMGNFFADQAGLNDYRVKGNNKTHDAFVLTMVIARNADTGEIELQSANYMPTITYRYKSSPNKYRIAPLGVISETRPAWCRTDADFEHFSNAFERVKSVVGTEVECFNG